jgi:hypothetical protein
MLGRTRMRRTGLEGRRCTLPRGITHLTHESLSHLKEMNALNPGYHARMKHSTPDTRHQTLDTRHETRDTRHETLDTRHETLNAKPWILNPEP